MNRELDEYDFTLLRVGSDGVLIGILEIEVTVFDLKFALLNS